MSSSATPNKNKKRGHWWGSSQHPIWLSPAEKKTGKINSSLMDAHIQTYTHYLSLMMYVCKGLVYPWPTECKSTWTTSCKHTLDSARINLGKLGL